MSEGTLALLKENFNEYELACIGDVCPPEGIDIIHNKLTAFGATTRFTTIEEMFLYLHNICMAFNMKETKKE